MRCTRRRATLSHVTAEILARLRARRPRVHCITNNVAQNFTANALLAAGCVPSMTLAAEEIGAFVASADALLVNLGTFDAERREAAATAIEVAAEEGVPWVLDPVFIDRSPPRAAYARTLIAQRPRVIRLNRAEFTALAGAEPDADALTVMRSIRSRSSRSPARSTWLPTVRAMSPKNGHPLMARVTAMGCAASALVAACLRWRATVHRDRRRADGVRRRRERSPARGQADRAVSRSRMLDALYDLDGDDDRPAREDLLMVDRSRSMHCRSGARGGRPLDRARALDCRWRRDADPVARQAWRDARA